MAGSNMTNTNDTAELDFLGRKDEYSHVHAELYAGLVICFLGLLLNIIAITSICCNR